LVGQRAHQRPLLAIALSLLLAACASGGDIAGAGRLEPAVVKGPAFDLQTWRRDDGSAPLTVYIEGDGFAYLDQNTASSDPTPRDAIGLRLAAADPGLAVLYIARPCQFVRDSRCTPRDWTVDRFNERMVAAIDAAIGPQQRKLILVGYSGGGVIAAQIATRRRDVERLITVAAPVDLDRWTRRLNLSPLGHAPIDVRVPHVAFAGELDARVPLDTATLPGARQIVVPGFDHRCCWAREWPRLKASAL
jgi:pimeloyl-ACP methyl ester carboxylesterase